MSHIFEVLTNEETQKVKEAIPYITILIAGADGNIDAKERAWAEKITGIRAYAEPEEYRSFYEEIGVDFQEKLDSLILALPDSLDERNAVLSSKISELNPILAKLENRVGAQLYSEFKRFASHVAKSSGGFLGFFSVGPKEAKYIDLPMLNEIELIEVDEEE